MSETFSAWFIRTALVVIRAVGFYLYSMIASSFNAAVHSANAVVGLAVGNNISPMVPAPNWEVAAAVFGTSFVMSMLRFLRDHPLPESLDTKKTVTGQIVTVETRTSPSLKQDQGNAGGV